MSKDDQVNYLLSLIEKEKRQPHPDKKQMRKWLSEIRSIRYEEDYRTVYTGQDAKFLMHTSMRAWRDDC